MRELTPYEVAKSFAGVEEKSGAKDNPFILAFLASCQRGTDAHELRDEIPWCSGFCSFSCMTARFERSLSLRARSWLRIGSAVEPGRERVGDVVIIGRGKHKPPATVIKAPGHVGFLAKEIPHPLGKASSIHILGGNQGDSVSVARFPYGDLLGFRRLRPIDPEPADALRQAAEGAGDMAAATSDFALRLTALERWRDAVRKAAGR